MEFDDVLSDNVEVFNFLGFVYLKKFMEFLIELSFLFVGEV